MQHDDTQRQDQEEAVRATAPAADANSRAQRRALRAAAAAEARYLMSVSGR
ncbi:MAG: hypothetical protein QOC95_23 [Thermoleophilaceae bacterium]|jgi:hypothetical protein|nr:hypothetical protein [Thermoleophilaceae bacterium]